MSRDFYKIHFIGIGGIGISGLARLFLVGGKNFLGKFVGTGQCPVPTLMVTGSDLVQSEITRDLEKLGAEIFIGKHRKENLFFMTPPIPPLVRGGKKSVLPLAKGELEEVGPNLVIYSAAVPKDNPELKEAQRQKIKCLTYSQALGQLTKKMFTIAVSGMHGKSTTAAMIALILQKAGLDPTAVIGTKLKEWQGANARVGNSKYLVIEADEWQASMLNYWPQIIVLTNIEEEHLDYYKNLNHIIETFTEYLRHLPDNGYLITNKDDKNSLKLKAKSEKLQFKVQSFSLLEPEAGRLRQILKIPGEHNISNALAALSTARVLGIKDQVSLKALAEFQGTWRRFEIIEARIKNKELRVVSDYAHHPTEIKAALKAARQKWPHKKIWVVFQPHQYQRTYFLFDKFVTAFDEADNLILVKIYDVAGRETSELKKKVNIKKLAQAIQKRDQKKAVSKKVLTAASLTAAKQLILQNIQAGNILIIMGAGDIYELKNKLLKNKKAKH